jgi:hypothetical protein
MSPSCSPALNFLFYYEGGAATLAARPSDALRSRSSRIASLIFWFGVLSFGRLLPYLGPGGG